MRMLKNKKSQSWASENTGMILLLALGFALVWIIISQLSLSTTVDKETCHTSVILKKTMIEKPAVGGKIIDVPLQCKTEKICITTGFLDNGCSFFEGSKNVNKISVSNKEELMKALADSMADCWGMMGESKGPMVFKREFDMKLYDERGVICSIIDFSDNIKKNKEKFAINTQDFSEYLNTHAVPEKEVSYWQFLTGSQTPNLVSPNSITNVNLDIPYSITFIEYTSTTLAHRTYLAFGAGVGAIAGTFVAPGIGTVAGIGIGTAAGNAIENKVSDFFTKNPEKYWSSIFLRPYDIDSLNSLNTDSFENMA